MEFGPNHPMAICFICDSVKPAPDGAVNVSDSEDTCPSPQSAFAVLLCRKCIDGVVL